MAKYKVTVTYVEAGMGHIVSAEAIANALETYYSDVVDVDRCYVFQETNDPILRKHEKYLVDAVKNGNRHKSSMYFLFVLLKIFPQRVTLGLSYAVAFPRARRRTMALLRKHDPDMIVSTHYTPLHCANLAKAQGSDFLSAVYIPDPNVHEWWDKHADLLAVNNPIAYDDAMKLGFDPEKTVLSRFVIRTNVQNTPRDRAAMREKYGLPKDNFTVIMAAGAYGEAHMGAFADAFLRIPRKYTLLIIAGTNEKVYEEFSEKAKNSGDIDVRVYHFCPDVHELYLASDLFVTKGGPNAILDSVYMETPVMVNFYSSPIERITKDLYVTMHRCGEYVPEAEEGARLLTSYIDDPALLEPYRENCRAFVRDCVGGEKQIADAIVETLKKHGPPKAEKNKTGGNGKA